MDRAAARTSQAGTRLEKNRARKFGEHATQHRLDFIGCKRVAVVLLVAENEDGDTLDLRLVG